MEDSSKTKSNNVIRVLCIISPVVYFLLLLSIFDLVFFYEMHNKAIASFIVILWITTMGSWIWVQRKSDISRLYKAAFIKTYIQQGLVLFFASLMLDGGFTLYACILAAVLYWMGTGIIIARRPLLPTTFDIGLISYSFIPLAFITSFISWIWNCY